MPEFNLPWEGPPIRWTTGEGQSPFSNPKRKREWLPRYTENKIRELRGYQLEIEHLMGKLMDVQADVAATSMEFEPIMEQADRGAWERRTQRLQAARAALGNARHEIATVVDDLEVSRG